MYNCYSLAKETEDLIFRPLSSTLIFTDLQHIIAMQNDSIDFTYEVNHGLPNKIVDIEKELFSELFLGNYQFNIAIYELDNFNKKTIVKFNSKKIKRIYDVPLNDDKNSTIFSMETNYLLICDYGCLKRIVEEVDIYDLEGWLDDKNHFHLDEFAKRMDHRFAIASIHSIDEGFDFCGSGTYIVPNNSVVLS